MTHIVMYKFPEKGYKPEYKEMAEKAFSDVKRNINGVTDVKVYHNCTTRPVNYDLMVMISLTDDTALQEYLVHPSHKAFSKEMDKYITDKARFDY